MRNATARPQRRAVAALIVLTSHPVEEEYLSSTVYVSRRSGCQSRHCFLNAICSLPPRRMRRRVDAYPCFMTFTSSNHAAPSLMLEYNVTRSHLPPSGTRTSTWDSCQAGASDTGWLFTTAISE